MPTDPTGPPASRTRPSVIVLGDLMLDVVLAPERPLEQGTDVPGRVMLRQGGSAASTARWLGRLGARVQLITAVGRDPAGGALLAAVRRDRVVLRAIRVAGTRTGRIGVLVASGGERSFVADRGAADTLGPGDLQSGWFTGTDALHLPAYSILGDPLGLAGRLAATLAREAGAVVSLDLASSGPLLAAGRAAARDLITALRPDLLFATESEGAALVGMRTAERLLALAPVAIVKRGSKGATVLIRPEAASDPPLRFDVATSPMQASDTTGAGDAFDAGFLVGWLGGQPAQRRSAAALRRAVVAGHRAAARQLTRPAEELRLG